MTRSEECVSGCAEDETCKECERDLCPCAVLAASAAAGAGGLPFGVEQFIGPDAWAEPGGECCRNSLHCLGGIYGGVAGGACTWDECSEGGELANVCSKSLNEMCGRGRARRRFERERSEHDMDRGDSELSPISDSGPDMERDDSSTSSSSDSEHDMERGALKSKRKSKRRKSERKSKRIGKNNKTKRRKRSSRKRKTKRKSKR
jgi:hypothetical protein